MVKVAVTARNAQPAAESLLLRAVTRPRDSAIRFGPSPIKLRKSDERESDGRCGNVDHVADNDTGISVLETPRGRPTAAVAAKRSLTDRDLYSVPKRGMIINSQGEISDRPKCRLDYHPSC